jgi:hypothetical protein
MPAKQVMLSMRVVSWDFFDSFVFSCWKLFFNAVIQMNEVIPYFLELFSKFSKIAVFPPRATFQE